MFKQKKTFSTIIVFYIFIQLCFSQVSIGGITVQNANSTNSETIETKYTEQQFNKLKEYVQGMRK